MSKGIKTSVRVYKIDYMSSNNKKINERDLALLKKVGKYYLQYKGIIDLDKLLSIIEATEELNIDNITRIYIIQYIIYLAVKAAVRAAKEAEKDRLTYKEFSIGYDQDIFGELNIDRTTIVYPQGLYAYYTYTEGYNAPEYGILGYLLRRIYDTAIDKFVEIKLHHYFNFTEKMKKFMKKLEEIKEKFPEGYYRNSTYTDPQWLIRAFRAYEIMKKLENIGIGLKRSKTEIKRPLIKFILWKLYELYIFYLIVNYLKKKGYRIKRKGDKNYLAFKDGIYFTIIFNSNLENSGLLRVNNYPKLEKFKGKPDISLDHNSGDKNNIIIIECKYSDRLSYISMGRFKIMAYVYEYNPLTAILVYPGLKEGQLLYDDEDKATKELDDYVKKNNYVKFEFKNHELYMARINPKAEDEKNLKTIDEILGKYI